MGYGVKMGALFKVAKGVFKYIISFLANGGSGSMGNVSVKVGKSTTLPANTYTKTGYSFLGWNTSSTATTALYADKATVKNLTKRNLAIVSLYAIWKAITYYVSYSGNGSTGGSTSTTTHTYDVARTLATNGFTKTGYTFKNWNTNSSGTGTSYSGGQSVTNLLSTSSATLPLYAIWYLNIGTTVSYSYTGGIQSYTILQTGLYKLEVYGAQGGAYTSGGSSSYPNSGGLGGYSLGYVWLTQGTVVYIAVGGQGTSAGYDATASGGYNGGGNSYGAGGGGATHIVTSTNRGILSNYASYKSEILIVAGGGGGGNWGNYNGYYGMVGGAGGGTTGAQGTRNIETAYPGTLAGYSYVSATGGSQSAGGTGGEATSTHSGTTGGNGSFGQGAGTDYMSGRAGGGGGYYGGGGGYLYAPSAGGSGYVGGVPTITYNSTTYTPSMSQGTQSGNGKAVITLMAV